MNHTTAAKLLREHQHDLITPEIIAATKVVLRTNFAAAQHDHQSPLHPNDVLSAASAVAIHHGSSEAKAYADAHGTYLIHSRAIIRFIFLLSYMPKPSSTGTRSHESLTHGGTVGIGLSLFMLFHQSLFGIDKKSEKEQVIEIGSNLGTFGVLASAASKRFRPTHLLECDSSRVRRSRKWASTYRSCRSKLDHDSREALFTFPTVYEEDVTTPVYAHQYMQSRLPWNMFLNNYGNCMVEIEATIENILINEAPISSVLICFSRMLLYYPRTWREEVLHTYIPAGQMPFDRKIGNPSQKKLLVIFKYTRVSEQEPPNGSRPRIRNYRPDRQSNEPPRGSSFLDYEHFATANNGALGVFSVFDNSF